MLFIAALAAAQIGNGPFAGGNACQRLNHAWRQVWSTCSINAYIPGTAGTTPHTPSVFPTFYLATGSSNVAGITAQSSVASSFPRSQMLDANGYFGNFWPAQAIIPGAAGTPSNLLCEWSLSTGFGYQRNRCRRMLDVYGNLVGICSSTRWAPTFQPNNRSPDYKPQPGHGPHSSNVPNLFGYYNLCAVFPGGALPTTANTCVGLNGWWTVVWNNCMLYAPGVSISGGGAIVNNPTAAPNVPGFLTPFTAAATGTTPGYQFKNPEYFCGASAPVASQTLAPNAWNARGPGVFTKSRCRKALDQFSRAASRCTTASTGNGDFLRYLAGSLANTGANTAGVSPYCNN
jgi:hypothetical protein